MLENTCSVKLIVRLQGTKTILNVLSEYGHPDLPYQLATRYTEPSWATA